MAAPKGHKQWGHRKKGSKNKFTRSAKEAFQIAFDTMGGGKALAAWAKENQTEFYKLYARLIPVDIGSGGESLFEYLIGKQKESHTDT